MLCCVRKENGRERLGCYRRGEKDRRGVEGVVDGKEEAEGSERRLEGWFGSVMEGK